MTTPEQARLAIIKHFQGLWTETPVIVQGEHGEPDNTQAWVEFGVIQENERPLTIIGGGGHGQALQQGYAYAKIYTPYDSGIEESDRLTDLAEAIFKDVTVADTDIRFKRVYSREQGVQGGNTFLVLMRAEFDFFEIFVEAS